MWRIRACVGLGLAGLLLLALGEGALAAEDGCGEGPTRTSRFHQFLERLALARIQGDRKYPVADPQVVQAVGYFPTCWRPAPPLNCSHCAQFPVSAWLVGAPKPSAKLPAKEKKKKEADKTEPDVLPPLREPLDKGIELPVPRPLESGIELPVPRPLESGIELPVPRPAERPIELPVPRPAEKPIELPVPRPPDGSVKQTSYQEVTWPPAHATIPAQALPPGAR
jgi:hypothetical protein